MRAGISGLGAHLCTATVEDCAAGGQVRSGDSAVSGGRPAVVRVLVDVPAVDRHFDYAVPDDLAGADGLTIGAIVRVDLHGRRVRGWVVGCDPERVPDVALKALSGTSGAGPPPRVVDLARWAARRWAGRPAHLLRTASPRAVVRALPAPALHLRRNPPGAAPSLVAGLLDGPGTHVVRLPPTADRWPLLAAVAGAGPTLVVVPSPAAATRLAGRLRRSGLPAVAVVDEGTPTAQARAWAIAAAGGSVVVGTRTAVWAPCPDHGTGAVEAVVVLDEHDEALQGEQAPTWHARDVAVERARRAGVPCLLVSPVPSPEAVALAASVRTPNPAAERAGWPVVEVVDRRDEDPTRGGLWSPRAATVLAERDRGRVLCLLNRTGRARLLACTACGTVAACERCGASVHQPEDGRLACRACHTERPVVCLACGAARMKLLRAGIGRAVEELAATLDEPVLEVTRATAVEAVQASDSPRVLVGTEAALHRLGPASLGLVVVVDLDQELLAPRIRAGQQALVLLARAARAVGGRADDGRLVVQTRWPDHPAVEAALHADPARFTNPELDRRRTLGQPPTTALAVVSGAAAPAWADAVEAARDAGAWPAVVEVMGPDEGAWLVRAADPDALADALAAIERPPGRLRIEVDPPRA